MREQSAGGMWKVWKCPLIMRCPARMAAAWHWCSLTDHDCVIESHYGNCLDRANKSFSKQFLVSDRFVNCTFQGPCVIHSSAEIAAWQAVLSNPTLAIWSHGWIYGSEENEQNRSVERYKLEMRRAGLSSLCYCSLWITLGMLQNHGVCSQP